MKNYNNYISEKNFENIKDLIIEKFKTDEKSENYDISLINKLYDKVKYKINLYPEDNNLSEVLSLIDFFKRNRYFNVYRQLKLYDDVYKKQINLRKGLGICWTYDYDAVGTLDFDYEKRIKYDGIYYKTIIIADICDLDVVDWKTTIEYSLSEYHIFESEIPIIKNKSIRLSSINISCDNAQKKYSFKNKNIWLKI